MAHTQTTTVTEAKTLVVTLAVGGAIAIAAAFVFGWKSMDTERRTAMSSSSAALIPSIVELSRH